MRFVLEGEWSGYHSGQRHVVHRTVITQKQLDKINEQKLSCIRYTDGTYLSLRTFAAKPRERVSEIHGYDQLIEDCIFQKCNSVDELIKKRKTMAGASPQRQQGAL
jgi:hypothetical protein